MTIDQKLDFLIHQMEILQREVFNIRENLFNKLRVAIVDRIIEGNSVERLMIDSIYETENGVYIRVR